MASIKNNKMGKEEPLLSICIPTYNRANKLIELLAFLKTELDNFSNKEDIEIVISNNCSTDNTEQIFQDYYNRYDYPVPIYYHCNERNIGGAKNFFSLINLSHGKYLWWLGDDDKYYEGIISKVYKYVVLCKYSYIFINFCAIKNGKVQNATMIEGVDVTKEDKSVLVDIFNSSWTSMMFVSASIHSRQILLDQVSLGVKVDMAFTLLMAFNSASKGKVKVIEEVLIADSLDGITWTDRLYKVFGHDVPLSLLKVFTMGYDKISWSKSVVKYLFNYWRWIAGYYKRKILK